MEKLQTTVAWYQQKIGSYDKALWENSVEQKVLHNIRQAPRRVVKPKTELIDVDLVRGSTFTKAKPQVPWTYITLKTFSRVVFLPFHYKWWIQQTSLGFWMFLMVLYIMQIVATVVFFNNVGEELTQDEQSLSEVMVPFILMVLLGLVHSQTIITHLKPPVRDSKRDAWRRTRSLSQNRGSFSTNTETVGNTTMSGDPSPSQSKSSMKGHLGSRPLRERTKERRVRLKTHKERVRPDQINEHGSQDSESAYHTHEPNDSSADRTSSVDNNHFNDGERTQDSSPTSSLVNGLKAENRFKKTESQESDFPKESNSEDDKLVIDKDGCEGSKRHSQSISSDNDDDDEILQVKTEVVNGENLVDCYSSASTLTSESKSEENLRSGWNSSVYPDKTASDLTLNSDAVVPENNVTNGTDTNHLLQEKINFEGKSHTVLETTPGSQGHCEAIVSVPSILSQENVMKFNEETDSSYVNVSFENAPALTSKKIADSTKMAASSSVKSAENVASCSYLANDVKPEISLPRTAENYSKIPPPPYSSVQFTKDLVQLREFTPKNSREGTPTHCKSESSIQRSPSLKSDSESDTDFGQNHATTKSMPNIRRRLVHKSESSEGTPSILRNRRQPNLNLRDNKGGTAKDVSSSEAETECSRSSRSSRKTMASSEEWGDHLQSDVDSTTETSSCDSDPAISGHEEPVTETEAENQVNSVGMTTSNITAINMLTSSNSSTHPPDKGEQFRSRSSSTSRSAGTSTMSTNVTCIIWERNECKKVELTALDIGWAIIETVDKIPESSDYIFIGLTFSVLMAATPFLFELFHSRELPHLMSWDILFAFWDWSTKNNWRSLLIHVNAAIQRLCLSAIMFFMLSVADRTFKQRLLYAKHFCYLTSSRRARKFDMPHLRLNKVRNIRTWLSLRSYLKKRGPQRSVDVIVSSAFLLTLIMLILMCLQLLRDAETYLNYLINWELVLWCMALGLYLLRYMTLGLRINKKYRNLSVLITEQINLYLQMEQKPHKKEELMVANNVLKLAETLLKELESPFKISGISANPLILNFTKVVVLSAFSAVLTELLGFKLKLYKIKLRA